MRLSFIFVILSIFLNSCFTSWVEELTERQYVPDLIYPEEAMDQKQYIQLAEQFKLPPDPGKKGKETLFGIDSDNDGLRDDIQRWIVFNYPEEPLIRKSLRQLAIDHIDTFRFIDDKEKSITSSHRSQESLNCVSDIFQLVYFKAELSPPSWISSIIIQPIENTPQRADAAQKARKNFSSEKAKSNWDKLSTCRFEVEHPNLEEYLEK
ncbi:MAG: hypothetical protein AB8G05_08170 [Oligoflexales bacterium]